MKNVQGDGDIARCRKRSIGTSVDTIPASVPSPSLSSSSSSCPQVSSLNDTLDSSGPRDVENVTSSITQKHSMVDISTRVDDYSHGNNLPYMDNSHTGPTTLSRSLRTQTQPSTNHQNKQENAMNKKNKGDFGLELEFDESITFHTRYQVS